MRKIVVDVYGGPDVLSVQEGRCGLPGSGQVLLRQTAVGVNFHDIYVRSGQYRTLALPGTPGIEAIGRVEAVGPGVDTLRVGDRVGYVTDQYGAYAEARLLDAALAVPIPADLDDVAAASVLLKGLTAMMLVREVRMVTAGETILVQAAAGGVGQLLCRAASAMGARVIGVVGSAHKASVARDAGATEVLVSGSEDIGARVRDLTQGEGVAAIYDSVGRDTFGTSIECLGYTGHLVNFGQSSGPVDPVALGALAARSLTLSRPVVFHYLRTRARLERLSGALFEALEQGVLKPATAAVFPLEQAAQAHRLLESRGATGAVVLTI